MASTAASQPLASTWSRMMRRLPARSRLPWLSMYSRRLSGMEALTWLFAQAPSFTASNGSWLAGLVESVGALP